MLLMKSGFLVIFERNSNFNDKKSEKWSEKSERQSENKPYKSAIPAKEQEEKQPERWSEKFPEITYKEKALLVLIRDNNKITRTQLAKNLNINQFAIQKYLKKLKEVGIIKRIGPDKGGYWEILE